MPWRHRRGTASPDLDHNRSGRQTTPSPGRFTPRERVPGIHCRGGCVGHTVGLDAYWREKISYPHRGSIPGTVQSRASRCTDWAIPASRSVLFPYGERSETTQKKITKGQYSYLWRYRVTALECFCSHNSSGPRTFSSHQIMEDVTKTRGKAD